MNATPNLPGMESLVEAFAFRGKPCEYKILALRECPTPQDLALCDTPARFSAHSVRAGLITSAAIAGVPERAIQDQSGHQSVTVLRRYIRDACIFRFNAVAKVGL